MPFWYDSKLCPVGAVLDVDPKDFNPRFMVKVEEPKPVETPKTEEVIIIGGPFTPEEPLNRDASPLTETKPKLRRVRKKDAP